LAKNTMVLYGRNSVFERLKANPKSIRKVFLEENFQVPYIEELIKKNNIPVERLSAKDLVRVKPTKDLQGITARVEDFKYSSFEELLERPQDQRLTLIFLDRISDPQNLGVIIRTAACFGEFALIIPKFQACAVTEAVLHVASGGENYVAVCMVSNISNAIIAAKKQGYWIMGALVSDDAKSLNKVSLPFPLAVVFGSEGEGIRYGVKKHLDLEVQIPMKGARLSFNVAMAGAIFCYEIARQKI